MLQYSDMTYNITKLNEVLLANGKEGVKLVDIAPESVAYHNYRKGDGERDAKKLERLRSDHLRNFYKYLAKQYPNLLFEADGDELYFHYNPETGIYEDWQKVHVQELITRMMIQEGFLHEAKLGTVNQTLVFFRAMFSSRGCHYDDFDTAEEWFHCSNGWVALELEVDGVDEKGLLKYKPRVFEEHTPKRLSRRISAVAFDAEATCPNYDKMMVDFKLADDIVRVIDQFSGLLLTSDISNQKMLAFIGRPGCGKSTIAEVWGKVLGEMAIRKDLNDLTGDRFRFIGKSLTGRTFVHFDEVDIKRSEMSSNLGNLITGDRFAVERKGKDEDPSAKNKLKCVLTANSLPASAEVGVYRRMILIEFRNSFYDNGEADLKLPAKLEAEFSGILNRMLIGLADIRKMETFTVIAGHEDAIEEYKVSSDILAEFLDEHFEPGTVNDGVSSTVMFNTYVKWLGPNRNRMTLTPQRFGQMLKNQPLRKFDIGIGRSDGGLRFRTGLKIKKCYKESQFDKILEEVNDDGVPLSMDF